MAPKFIVDPDIKKASTLPASFYRDPAVFEVSAQRVFKRTWQLVEPHFIPRGSEVRVPFQLLDGFIKEPLLLASASEESLICLSNVCTHRGNLLVRERTTARKLVCGYHGRRFSWDGTFEFMPEFEQAEDFPSPCDHLPQFPLISWGPLWFTSLDPAFDFSAVRKEMDQRIGFLPFDNFKWAEVRSRTYEVQAHWALYCDNYLEGFHIPFVHKDLNAVLDYGQYDTKLFENGCLQTGYADGKTEAVFELPEGHVDYGRNVAAYYFWIFPNLMFNFYPWGLSLNVVTPVNKSACRVKFLSFVYDKGKLEKGAGAGLDKVELEDEAVVEGVQQGMESGLYSSGRFSPSREQGVHHFHRMLASYMNAPI